MIPAVLLAQAPALPREVDARTFRGLDSIADAFRRDQKLPGLAIAVAATDGRLLHAGAYGLADLAAGRPVTGATLFRLYSISKTYAAAVAHLLVEAGDLALDAPVGRYLPALPAWRDRVTVRQLLDHTSGIPDYTDLPGYDEATHAGGSVDDAFLDLALARPLEFQPGTAWRYSNAGYALLQRVIERATGETLAALLAAHVLEPAGLRETSPACPLDRMATGYTEAWRAGLPGDSLVVSPGRNRRRVSLATGGLCGTARDVARFFGLLAGGGVVGEASLAAMRRRELAGASRSGAGLFVHADEEGTILSHAGGGGNSAGEAMVFPADGLAFAAVTNAGGGPDLPRLLRTLRRHLLGLPQPALLDLPSPREEWSAFLGEYVDSLQQRIAVLQERDSRPYAFGARLLKQADGTFASEGYQDWRLHFRLVAGGAPELVITQYGVVVMRGRRRS